LLVAGKLDDAKTRAFLLTKAAPDPGMARWQREVDEVGEAARSLVAATSIDEALRREVRVAAACATCHLGAQNRRRARAQESPCQHGTVADTVEPRIRAESAQVRSDSASAAGWFALLTVRRSARCIQFDR
jgi:hypothetical protein